MTQRIGKISLYVVFNELVPWGLCFMMASILIYVYRWVLENGVQSKLTFAKDSFRKIWDRIGSVNE